LAVIAFGIQALSSQAFASSNLKLCVRFDDGIPNYSRQLITEHLLAYQDDLGSKIGFDCDTESGVEVRFLKAPQPPHPSDALGAVRVHNGEVRPEIVIFYQPVRMLLPTRLPGIEARALAKVLAHELSHLVSNRTSHRGSGLNAAVFSAAYLMSADLRE
jgi:hypothetical protein